MEMYPSENKVDEKIYLSIFPEYYLDLRSDNGELVKLSEAIITSVATKHWVGSAEIDGSEFIIFCK